MQTGIGKGSFQMIRLMDWIHWAQEGQNLPVIQFAGTTEARAAEIRRLAPGVAIEVSERHPGVRELLDLKAEVEASRDALRKIGIEIVSTGIDTQANAVIAGVEELAPTVAITMTNRFGPGVGLRVDRAVEANVTYRSLCAEATVRRQGVETWTAPPAPTRTPAQVGQP